MDDIARAPPTPPHLYETCIAAERAWIADVEGAIAGFLTWMMQDGHQFITELHVDPRYQGARISAQLIGRLVRPSLSCFTEVPWNRPYYQRLGFRTVDPAALGAQHCAIAAEEHRRFAPWPRCIMVR
ncbi:MAG: GNAT family N-acetyltransferase [Pseudomonadota bacterium]